MAISSVKSPCRLVKEIKPLAAYREPVAFLCSSSQISTRKEFVRDGISLYRVNDPACHCLEFKVVGIVDWLE